MFSQMFFVLHCEVIDELHVVDDFTLVMFGKFLTTAL